MSDGASLYCKSRLVVPPTRRTESIPEQKNLLHALPPIKTDPEALGPLFVQASTKIRVSLWDHKVDGAFPMNLVDWSIESYSVEHPLVPERTVTMYRVFDMTVG